MNIGAMLTLVFAGLAALTGVLTVLNEFAKQRAERTLRRHIEEALWTLEVIKEPNVQDIVLKLRYTAAEKEPIRLCKARITEPKGAVIAQAVSLVGENGRGGPLTAVGDWASTLIFNLDLRANAPPGYDVNRLSFLIRLDEPAIARAENATAHLVLDVETRTAGRNRKQVHVKSQEIDWAASIPTGKLEIGPL